MPNPSALTATRRVAATPARLYAAFANPDLLARWWGPKGFTNTFESFDFRPGGRWKFVMHGPNGADYANESIFSELEADSRVVIVHVVPPWFELAVTFTPDGDATRIDWVQTFESPEMAAKIGAAIGNANEENLDRLEALLAATA